MGPYYMELPGFGHLEKFRVGHYGLVSSSLLGPPGLENGQGSKPVAKCKVWQTNPIRLNLEIVSVLLGIRMVRPGGFELPTFWFVGKQSKTLSAASGVVYRGTRHLSRS